MYREPKSDTFLAVSASAVFLVVCDADVVQDILSRKDDFPKPPIVHPGLDIYGTNVVTTSGQEWKKRRRIITPHFGENYNRLAWTKGLEKTRLLVKSWSTRLPNETESPLLRNTFDDFMRLTLTITSFNMFGRDLRWPNRISTSSPSDNEDGPPTDEKLPESHKMTFQCAVKHMVYNCNILMVSPSWYLKCTPNRTHRKAGQACRELGVYLKEMVEEKRKQINSGTSKGGDLITALIRAQADEMKSAKGDAGLTEQDVIGETFMLIFTGFATTTHVLHHTIMLLAIYPEYQLKLQEDLDQILGDGELDYERYYPALAESWAGAIFHEVNRLYPALPLIPKWTPTPQYITVKGAKHLLPQNTLVLLDCCNIHRNPKYWVPPHETEEESALNEFRPQRWLKATNEGFQKPTIVGEGEGEGIVQGGSFLRPYKGSYLPWSDGQRVCLGKKYSIVELLAVYAEIFKRGSVELDVRDGETLEEARSRAKKYMAEVDPSLALKPKGREPGIRYVKRGEERYFPKKA